MNGTKGISRVRGVVRCNRYELLYETLNSQESGKRGYRKSRLSKSFQTYNVDISHMPSSQFVRDRTVVCEAQRGQEPSHASVRVSPPVWMINTSKPRELSIQPFECTLIDLWPTFKTYVFQLRDSVIVDEIHSCLFDEISIKLSALWNDPLK